MSARLSGHGGAPHRLVSVWRCGNRHQRATGGDEMWTAAMDRLAQLDREGLPVKISTTRSKVPSQAAEGDCSSSNSTAMACPTRCVGTPSAAAFPAFALWSFVDLTYLIGTRLGPDAEVRFLGDLAAGNLIAEPVVSADWLRIAELVARHGDLPLGTADASVIAAAERLSITSVATLDHRHFGVVRPQHGPLDLLP